MKTTQRFLVIMITLGAVAGCELFPPTLVEQGIVTIDIKNSHPVSVSRATVYREDRQIVVRGKALYPLGVPRGMFHGHMDINIVLPNGESIKRTDVRLTLERIPEDGREASFVARFAIDPPRGTVVHLVYHDGSHG
tara:strand:+ start:5035 stop:5442 length:408 start_codon:yes stop_codon:yes gene_type:complete